MLIFFSHWITWGAITSAITSAVMAARDVLKVIYLKTLNGEK
jgi:hypothetical protein